MLNASNGLTPLILTASPRGRYYSYPRFIDEETTTEKLKHVPEFT